MNQNQQNQGTRNYTEVAAGGSDNQRWEPNKNENNPNYPKQIEGYFKKTTELPGKNGSFMVAEIQLMNADGTFGACIDVSGGRVLEEKLRAIPLNSFIMIQFKGKVQGKQNTYNDWATFVDEGAIPLNQLMGVAPAPQQQVFNQAPVQNNMPPATQQTAPVFGGNPTTNAPAQQNNVFGGQQQQAAPVFGGGQQQTAQPVFNQQPVQQNAAPVFGNQQQVNNGQMTGVQQGTNPFGNQVNNSDLPF